MITYILGLPLLCLIVQLLTLLPLPMILCIVTIVGQQDYSKSY